MPKSSTKDRRIRRLKREVSLYKRAFKIAVQQRRALAGLIESLAEDQTKLDKQVALEGRIIEESPKVDWEAVDKGEVEQPTVPEELDTPVTFEGKDIE